jgi:hypothetical protein
VNEIFPNHDGARRLDEVVLFDEGDELARTGLLRFEVKGGVRFVASIVPLCKTA